MSFSINITALGFSDADAALARLNPLEAQGLLSGLGRMIREQTVERITAGGPAPSGVSWAANSEGRSPVLFKSGALARSIDYRADAAQVVVGSGLIYAAIHQYGGVILPKEAPRLAYEIGNRMIFAGKVTMPARPYLGLSASDRAEASKAVVLFLQRLFR